MSEDLADNCCYVRATCNYQYPHKGRDVTMTKDEVFLLIRKTTDDWWQVIRSGDNKTFFAPSKYLEVTDVSIDSMKSSLRKKMAHQRHLQNQQRLHLETRRRFWNKEGGDILPISQSDSSLPRPPDPATMETVNNSHSKNTTGDRSPLLNAPLHRGQLIDPPQAFLDANKNESCFASNPRQHATTELSRHRVPDPFFQANSPSVASYTNDQGEENLLDESIESVHSESLMSSSVHEKTSICSTPDKHTVSSELESVSTHTSKSSLNDASRSSVESFCQIRMRSHMVGKAASFDVLQAENDDDEPLSPMNGAYPKAASSEELDRGNQRREFLFDTDRLTHRNRSNSVDLKRFDNNLDLSECEKVTSLEKSRKCRLTRDPMNRRRSWALNESYSLSSFYKNTVAGEQDASMILDTPPKLPPKMKKSISSLSCSSDNLHRVGIPPVEEIQPYAEGRERGTSDNPCGTSTFLPPPLPKEASPEPQQKVPHPVPLPRNQVTPPHLEETEKSVKNPLEEPPSPRPSTADNPDGWMKSHKEVEELEHREREEEIKEVESMKEKRVGELIGRIENQTKLTETNPRGKPQIQSPPSPTGIPRRIVFDDWGEYVDKASGRPFYFNSRTREKRWKPPRKSICSSIITDSPPPMPREKVWGSSFRPVKVPSPVLPSQTPIPLWPNRERSFTVIGPPGGAGVTARSHMSLSESVSVNPTKSSLTLPSTTPSGMGLSPEASKGSFTLPPHPVSPKEPSPTTKASRSFFSTISSSLSFIKHSSSNHGNASSNHTPPQVPPSSSKPLHGGAQGSAGGRPGSPTPSEGFEEDGHQLTLQSALERFHVPRGWVRKYDALSHQVYFESLFTGEKWNPAIDKTGTVYVYSSSGGESKWKLPEYDDLSPTSPHSPSLTPTDGKEKWEVLREDIMVWRLNMKEGKKAKKSWVTSYARYYPDLKKNVFGKSYGCITFSKKANEAKKVETFDLVPPCYVDFHQKKQNSLCLRNGDHTEILLQADTSATAMEWTKLLIEHDKVQEKNLSAEKDKKSTKVPDKSQWKKDALDEAEATKGIKDHLMLFFKRRIQQETLAKKGIYKDTVFGSTIGDLCQKEQLNTPMFVLQCIRNIEKNRENFLVDGLYRISGNASRIQKIRIEIAQNRYAILEEEKDVHNLTGSLKLFFRELKEPLIPFANYQSVIQATDHMKSKTRTEALRQAVKKLPLCNRETLKILLDHLLKVNEFEHENRMSVMNLAIVFGPCLLWPETTSGFDLMTDAMLHNRVVEALLTDFEDVFRKR